jgi:hypothetical protein
VLTLAVGKEGELTASGLLSAVDPAGVATVAWKNELAGGKLMLRRVQPNGTLSTLVPDVTGGSPTEPRIAALLDGSTLFIWRSAFIERIVVSPSQGIGAPQQVSGDNQTAEPELANDSQGNALATWRRDAESTFGLRGRLLDPSGNPVGEELIFRADLPEGLDNRMIASDSSDDFLVTWWGPDVEGDNIVHARAFNSLTGVMGPEQTLSDEDKNSVTVSAAIDDFGTGAVAWNEPMGMAPSVPLGRTIDSLGAPIGGIQQLFFRASVARSSSAPAAGVAAFLLDTPFNEGIRSAVVRRYLVPPRCANSSATVVQGRPVDAPLACTAAAIEGANVIEPPKHGQTGAFRAGPALEYTPTPGFAGTDSFTYSALNDGGGSNVARVEIKVGKDTVKPKIKRFRFAKGARASTSKSRPARKAYAFVLRISEPARARVTVERTLRGLRQGKRCGKARQGQTGKRCTLYVKAGGASAKAARENLRISVRGKLARGLAKGGRFRAKAVATDPAGNKSKPRTLLFRVRSG